jgi:hypothetical protein
LGLSEGPCSKEDGRVWREVEQQGEGFPEVRS